MTRQRRKRVLALGVMTFIGVGVIFPMKAVFGEKGTSVSKAAATSPSSQVTPYRLAVPLGLEDPNTFLPSDNPLTAEKVELGRLLFFDKRLSKDNSIACASCHMPTLAFTDGQQVSSGIKHLQGGRSAPASITRVYSKVQFWDGRAPHVRSAVDRSVRESG